MSDFSFRISHTALGRSHHWHCDARSRHPEGEARQPAVFVSLASAELLQTHRTHSLLTDYANVALKVNVKLSGVNSTVNLGPAVAGKPTVSNVDVLLRAELMSISTADDLRSFTSPSHELRGLPVQFCRAPTSLILPRAASLLRLPPS